MKPGEALELPLPSLAAALRRREVTARALAEESLHRLSTRGRTLNAVAALMEQRAFAAADRADAELATGHARGPLHGVPYGIKDLFSTRSAPTTWGTRVFAGRTIDEDAEVVARLDRAGAVPVAKLAMVQLAGGFGYYDAAASLQGPGKNPWDQTRWAGGSSSGSGAAVAARCVPLAVGTETWGSILVPSAFCGVTGLRPSFGRVSRAGGMTLAWTLDKPGPIARSAEDAWLALKAMAGPDERDAATLAQAPLQGLLARGRGLRVAVVLPGSMKKQDPEIFAAHEATVAALSRVVEIEPFAYDVKAPPANGIAADAVAAITVAAEEATSFEDLIDSGKLAALTGTDAPAQAEVDRSIRAVDYLRAQRLRAKLREGYRELFRRYDAICTPSLGFNAVPPPKLTEDLNAALQGEDPFGAAGNLLGLPAVAVPGPKARGLPTSMQLLGPAWGEATVVGLAHALQQHTSWHLERPPG